jgi:hypothetical protein
LEENITRVLEERIRENKEEKLRRVFDEIEIGNRDPLIKRMGLRDAIRR